MSDFTRGLLAAEKALELFSAGSEDSPPFTVMVDSAGGTIAVGDHVIHVREGGSHRVTCGTALITSANDPTQAVIEAVIGVISVQTRKVLREFFENNEIR